MYLTGQMLNLDYLAIRYQHQCYGWGGSAPIGSVGGIKFLLFNCEAL